MQSLKSALALKALTIALPMSAPATKRVLPAAEMLLPPFRAISEHLARVGT